MRTLLITASALALAACGGEGDGNVVTAPAGSVENVAAPAGQNWTEVIERTPEGGFRMGNPDAPLKLVEYGSRTCPACANFSETASEPLKQQYVASGKVSFEYRDFIRSPLDIAASIVGQCGGTAAFFPMLEGMMADQAAVFERLEAQGEALQTRLQGMPPAQQAAALADALGYVEFAKARGVPEPQLRQCLADTNAAQALADGTQSAAQEYNLPGTPTFLLNGKVVPNAVAWPQVEQALKAAGA